jgi:hypothetical protein
LRAARAEFWGTSMRLAAKSAEKTAAETRGEALGRQTTAGGRQRAAQRDRGAQRPRDGAARQNERRAHDEKCGARKEIRGAPSARQPAVASASEAGANRPEMLGIETSGLRTSGRAESGHKKTDGAYWMATLGSSMLRGGRVRRGSGHRYRCIEASLARMEYGDDLEWRADLEWLEGGCP